MKQKTLWVVRDSHNNIVFAGNDKMQAKHERDRHGGVAKGFRVSPGILHWKSHMPKKTHYKTKGHKKGQRTQ